MCNEYQIINTIGMENKEIASNPRIIAFDILKFFAIFLVVWGHSIHQFLSSDGSSNQVYRLIYSFHMSLFMMISGYFSFSSLKKRFYEFVVRKFLQLIYPCFVWGAISWIFLESISCFHYGNPEFSVIGLIFDYYWLSDFWFLKSCFICYCLLYITSHIGMEKKYWVTLSLILSQMITPFFVSFMYPCFLVGYELRQDSSFKEKVVRLNFVILLVFVFLSFFWNQEVWNKSHGIPNTILHLPILVEILFCRFFRLMIGVIGALAVISFTLHYYNRKNGRYPKMVQMCSEVGKYTLEIYILQTIILERFLGRFLCLDCVNLLFFDYFLSPLISFVLLILCYVIAKLIYKTKHLGKLLFWKSNGL